MNCAKKRIRTFSCVVQRKSFRQNKVNLKFRKATKPTLTKGYWFIYDANYITNPNPLSINSKLLQIFIDDKMKSEKIQKK